jgi:predicted dehydrogenase
MVKLRVGIIGAGEVAQVIHLPTLSLLSDLYEVRSVCDISEKNASHCATKFHIPSYTTNPYVVIHDETVDVVFVLTSDEFHAVYVIAALEAGKHVMVEKPITLSVPAAQRIVDAERKAGGKARVFVGYMRRYAPSFTGAFKREIASIPRILYARVRDFPGPNAFFISQSGTFQVKNQDDDIPPEASVERERLLDELFQEAFPLPDEGRPSKKDSVSTEQKKYCRFLNSLGSHDISLMRETLGFPDSVVGVSVNHPFYSAIFNYKDPRGNPFAVTYESGVDSVPDFDAHLAIYGEKKRVSIHYDTPYVKGLPITVRVEEINDNGDKQTREMVSSYEDAYTAELQEMYDCLVKGKEIKTTAEDAMDDLRLFGMMYRKYAETVSQ